MFTIKIAKSLQKLALEKGVKINSRGVVNPKKSLINLSKTVNKTGKVSAFVVPPIGVSAATALAASGKVIKLGKGADTIIANTRALAALGDKDAARGLSALMTAKAMVNGGVKIAAPSSKIKAGTFRKAVTKTDVEKLALQKADSNPGLWVRIKRWIGNRI